MYTEPPHNLPRLSHLPLDLSIFFFVSPSFILILNSKSSSYFIFSIPLSVKSKPIFSGAYAASFIPSGGVRFFGPMFIFIANFSFSLHLFFNNSRVGF